MTTEENAIPKAMSCALCSLKFSTVLDQRSHVRSDLHAYNLKQKMRGSKPVSEVEFEKLVGDLGESLSGSDSSSSESDDADGDGNSLQKQNGDLLSSLLKRQANVSESVSEGFSGRKRKRGSGRAPLLWFKSSQFPKNTSLGIYRALFTLSEQRDEPNIVPTLQKKQLISKSPPKNPDDGGVALPNTDTGPQIFLCMIGGGHFAAMVVSLAPKTAKKQGTDERQASVVAHKTFHRYTTRRKQGGAQSANDSSKGSAHSAGSSLRRYNEIALTDEVRGLLSEWKTMIDKSELLFIRATGSTNRRTLFGPYDSQVLRQDDPRNRGFPFSTRRATQGELMRCFIELTCVKFSQIDEEVRARAIAEAEAQAKKAAQEEAQRKQPAPAPQPKLSPEEEAASLHTTQITALIRRSKAPGLVSYISSNSISLSEFRFYPESSHHHAPTPLHLAAANASPALVTALLIKARADPTVQNGEGRTPFEVASDRPTRDAFRIARSELGEEAREWGDSSSGARVASALSRAEVDGRNEQERKEEEAKEAQRRHEELVKLLSEEQRKEKERIQRGDAEREKKMGKGRIVGALNAANQQKTAEERREEESRGMTPEMKARMEREKRARAAEERMKRLQGGNK